MTAEEELTNLRVARDAIVDSLRKLQVMESISTVIISQATTAGYESGWHDAAMTAVEALEERGYKAAAAIVKQVADLGNLPEA